MNNANVLGFLSAPDREMSLKAISLALLKVRAIDNMTCEKLAKAIGCCVDTVRNATNEGTLLSFDSVAALLYHFPEHTQTIRQLYDNAPVLTPADRLERMARDLEALRQEVAR